MPQSNTAFMGLRTAKYSAPDIAAAKAWYSKVLESKPYFDEPFYVGFNVGGFELGITPEADAPKERPEAGIAYWGVADCAAAHARLLALGARELGKVQEVGEGIKVSLVADPEGNAIGIIENPHFKK